MSPSWGVFYPYLELAESLGVALQRPRQPQLLQLLLQTRRQAGVHAAAAREDDRLEQGRADIHIGRLDRVEQELAQTRGLAVNQMWLEKTLGRLESFTAHADHTSVRQRVVLHQHSRVLAQTLVELEIVRHVAELLLDLPDSLEVGCSVEGVPAAEEQLDKVARNVATSHV